MFKKQPANSFRDSITDKNALKTKDEFAREGLELRRTRGTTTTEKREIKLSESLLSEIKSSDLNISDSLQFDTLEGGAMIDGKEYKGDIIIITKDRIIK